MQKLSDALKPVLIRAAQGQKDRLDQLLNENLITQDDYNKAIK